MCRGDDPIEKFVFQLLKRFERFDYDSHVDPFRSDKRIVKIHLPKSMVPTVFDVSSGSVDYHACNNQTIHE